ncbi:hypothetical protein, partial [Pseudomonas savastanoi]|uniref:hypothetical protein n=1 Tax=Pseudomonas savastanoi TaxID=29438 RepID=UPI001C7E6FF9
CLHPPSYMLCPNTKFLTVSVAAVVFSKNKLSDVIQRHQLHFMAEIGQKHFGVPQNTQVTVCQGVI